MKYLFSWDQYVRGRTYPVTRRQIGTVDPDSLDRVCEHLSLMAGGATIKVTPIRED